MNIVERTHEEMKAAMRSGDTLRRDTLRYLESALKNEAIEKRVSPQELSDEEAIRVIRRGVKQREDSASQYREGGRDDLAVKEDAEREILSTFLPAEPSSEEIAIVVDRAIVETGASTMKDMGRVIGVAMRLLPIASGGSIRLAVERRLKGE